MTTSQRSSATGRASALLESPRFELMPFDSFDEQVHHLPDGATVTITASPALELEATIETAEEAAEAGYEVVPHVSARYVRDSEHLAEICERLKAVGISDIFVPGGDREEPIGEFTFAYDMLTALDDRDVRFSSFYEGALAAVRERDATVPLAPLCVDLSIGSELAARYDAGTIHPSLAAVRAADAVPTDRTVNVWTIRTWHEAREAVAAGADGLIADYPGLTQWL